MLEGIGGGIGMDCSIRPTRFKDIFCVSTIDFFYPLVEDPYLQVSGDAFSFRFLFVCEPDLFPFFFLDRDELHVRMFYPICTHLVFTKLITC
jgi:hypothetical protein